MGRAAAVNAPTLLLRISGLLFPLFLCLFPLFPPLSPQLFRRALSSVLAASRSSGRGVSFVFFLVLSFFSRGYKKSFYFSSGNGTGTTRRPGGRGIPGEAFPARPGPAGEGGGSQVRPLSGGIGLSFLVLEPGVGLSSGHRNTSGTLRSPISSIPRTCCSPRTLLHPPHPSGFCSPRCPQGLGRQPLLGRGCWGEWPVGRGGGTAASSSGKQKNIPCPRGTPARINGPRPQAGMGGSHGPRREPLPRGTTFCTGPEEKDLFSLSL